MLYGILKNPTDIIERINIPGNIKSLYENSFLKEVTDTLFTFISSTLFTLFNISIFV